MADGSDTTGPRLGSSQDIDFDFDTDFDFDGDGKETRIREAAG
jgi:hypothetical protein